MASQKTAIFLTAVGLPLLFLALATKHKEPRTSDTIMTILGGTAAIVGIISTFKNDEEPTMAGISAGISAIPKTPCSACTRIR